MWRKGADPGQIGFPYFGVLGQVCNLIVSIPGLCLLLTFKTNYRFMQVKGNILQYVRPSLGYNLSLRSFLFLFFEWLLKTGFNVFLIVYTI